VAHRSKVIAQWAPKGCLTLRGKQADQPQRLENVMASSHQGVAARYSCSGFNRCDNACPALLF
jgi:hypothetical protein